MESEVGKLNWPSPDPAMPAWQPDVQTWKALLPSSTPQPHMRWKVPSESNFWIRWLPRSAT